jgi:hypothetical protein
MQHAAAGGTHSDILDQYRSVVSDLTSLIERVQTAIRQVEEAIACEVSPGNQALDDVVVLDDVTPSYMKADAALNACSARLGAALHVLLD